MSFPTLDEVSDVIGRAVQRVCASMGGPRYDDSGVQAVADAIFQELRALERQYGISFGIATVTTDNSADVHVDLE